MSTCRGYLSASLEISGGSGGVGSSVWPVPADTLFVVFFMIDNRKCPVKLLEENYAAHLMGESEP